VQSKEISFCYQRIQTGDVVRQMMMVMIIDTLPAEKELVTRVSRGEPG
jgi:hypothetical protein